MSSATLGSYLVGLAGVTLRISTWSGTIVGTSSPKNKVNTLHLTGLACGHGGEGGGGSGGAAAWAPGKRLGVWSAATLCLVLLGWAFGTLRSSWLGLLAVSGCATLSSSLDIVWWVRVGFSWAWVTLMISSWSVDSKGTLCSVMDTFWNSSCTGELFWLSSATLGSDFVGWVLVGLSWAGVTLGISSWLGGLTKVFNCTLGLAMATLGSGLLGCVLLGVSWAGVTLRISSWPGGLDGVSSGSLGSDIAHWNSSCLVGWAGVTLRISTCSGTIVGFVGSLIFGGLSWGHTQDFYLVWDNCWHF